MPLFVISSPGEEKAQLGSYQDKITGAQTGIQKISSKYKEKASVTEGCLNTARGCSGGVSMLGDVQNPTQWGHRQLAVADLHWAQGLDQTISRAHRESTTLWFCLQSLLHCMSCRDVSHRLHKFFFFFLNLFVLYFLHALFWFCCYLPKETFFFASVCITKYSQEMSLTTVKWLGQPDPANPFAAETIPSCSNHCQSFRAACSTDSCTRKILWFLLIFFKES